jgi:ubiquitin-activating enzyme E1
MEISPDENLYSRQMAALGAETQSKLIQMKILISGLTGVITYLMKNIKSSRF